MENDSPGPEKRLNEEAQPEARELETANYQRTRKTLI
jgi:hypothetical protein